ncbi:cytochrome P450 [Streptomyces sp. WG-D5]
MVEEAEMPGLDGGWKRIDESLNDPSWYVDMDFHAAFRRLRDDDPVHWTEATTYGRSYWSITRYDDVQQVLCDERTFSSRHPWSSGRMPRNPKRLTPEERFEQGLESRLNNIDPPVHTYFRQPVNKYFSVPAVGKMAQAITDYVSEIAERIADSAEVDLIEDVAAQLPVQVILRWLGVPEADWPLLKKAAAQYTLGADPRYTIDDDPVATAEHGLKTLIGYAVDLAEDRRRNPNDDFASAIATLRMQGEPLSIHEIRGWFTALILGGIETSRNAIGAGLWQLLLHPGQRRDLLEGDKAVADSFADEVVRWTSPARNLLRVAAHDVELQDKEIRAGDWVVLHLASANWDERKFERPEQFDIHRRQQEQLGTGAGIHRCLGRHLVRLELITIARQLLSEFPDMQIVSEPAWLRDVSSSGLSTLMVSPGRRVARA